MLTRTSRIPSRVLAAALLATSAACAPGDMPTDPATVTPWTGELAAARVRNNLRLTAASLATTTLAINGGSTTATVTVEYDGNAKSATGVLVQNYVVQGPVVAAAGGQLANCGLTLGVVASGVPCTFSYSTSAANTTVSGVPCTFSYSTSAANTTVSGGFLTPGAATLEVRLYQTVGNKTTLLQTRTIAVTLVPNRPYIESVVFQSTTIFVGVPMPYTIIFHNPTGVTQTNLQFSARFEQGTRSSAGGGSLLNCGGALGELPPGDCSMNFTTTASATAGFVEGPASWVVKLLQGLGTPTEIETKTYSVSLSFPIT